MAIPEVSDLSCGLADLHGVSTVLWSFSRLLLILSALRNHF